MDLRPLILSYEGVEPTIDPTAWLAANATVIGDARIEAWASVFYGAVVRADMAAVHLGARSNLQDNVVVHTDTDLPAIIGAGVTVGHAAVVHGCMIEDQCLIGMHATVLNGAVVGAGSLVAAGAVVREGDVVPPRSLVAGVPGKVRRELTEQEYQRVVSGAGVYVDLAARHRASANPIRTV
ncbi:MAG TPA: gamma carbonic anhydrase family protein [Propionibacteriaceae bacterium]|nr:gamma carbonic anhydrase family protein [Propionibacteriaceae bacterium]